MSRLFADNRPAKQESDWGNLLLPCGLLFALLGYVWMNDNETIGYILMVTGLVVGVGGMAISLRAESRQR